MTRKTTKKATAAEKAKGVASTSDPPPSPPPSPPHFDDEDLPLWPYRDGQPIPYIRILPELRAANITNSAIEKLGVTQRQLGGNWVDYNSLFYNRWLRMTIKSTPVVCKKTLDGMGIRKAVMDILQRMGLGTLPYRAYKVYPELVRQFYATVMVHREQGADPRDARVHFLSFLVRGVEYRITIPEICSIFGFDADLTECGFPAARQSPFTLYELLAHKVNTPREFKIASIRNPVVRVVAKIIGMTFFGREEAGSLALTDMHLLYYGLPDASRTIYPAQEIDDLPPTLRVNVGYLFAQELIRQRPKGLSVPAKGKDDLTGSLLTPIFQKVGIRLRSETAGGGDTSYFDVGFFTRARILKGEPGIYMFLDSDDRPHTVQLPVQGFTLPDSAAALSFVIPPELYLETGRRQPRTRPPPSLQASASSSAGPAAFVWEDVPEDITEGWPVLNRNLRKLAEFVMSGCTCRGRGSRSRSRTAGAANQRGFRGRAEQEDDGEDVLRDYDEDAEVLPDDTTTGANFSGAIIPYDLHYVRRRRRRAALGDTHSVSTDEGA